jgi:hypothetical protein
VRELELSFKWHFKAQIGNSISIAILCRGDLALLPWASQLGHSVIFIPEVLLWGHTCGVLHPTSAEEEASPAPRRLPAASCLGNGKSGLVDASHLVPSWKKS